MIMALEGGEWSASRSGRSLLPGKTLYTLYRRLGGPQGWPGQVRNMSPPLGFDHRTVQPVTNRYTNWATRPTDVQYIPVIMISNEPQLRSRHLSEALIISILTWLFVQWRDDIHNSRYRNVGGKFYVFVQLWFISSYAYRNVVLFGMSAEIAQSV